MINSYSVGSSVAPACQGQHVNVPVEFGGYDCLDIGADTNSLSWAREFFGIKKPLGINIDPARLDNMKQAGENCLHMNALDIPASAKFKYVMMSHLIEHMESTEQVCQTIELATKIAANGVYISGPYFEDDDYIRQFGVKFAWGDWIDHISRRSISHFLPWAQERYGNAVSVSLGFPAIDALEDNIFALEEAPNKGKYLTDKTVDKPSVRFSRPAFQEYVVFIRTNPCLPLSTVASIHSKRHGIQGVLAWNFLTNGEHDLLNKLYTLKIPTVNV